MKPHSPTYFDTDVARPFLHTGGDQGIVLLHGFTGCVAHLRPLGDRLHSYGYTVLGINLPGHATYEQDMAKTGHREWLQAARDAVTYLRLQCRNVTVCGLSMGALLALILAGESLADACVAISTPLPARQRLMPIAGILHALHPRITWKDNINRKYMLNQKYDLGYSGFPTRKGKDLFDLIKLAEKSLANITCPLLAVQSTGDHTVSPESADIILQGVQSMTKEKLILHDVPHACTISEKMPEIADRMHTLIHSLSGIQSISPE